MWQDLEQFFYESRPYLYALIGAACLFKYENTVLFVSGLILGFCSASVFHLRSNYRHVGAQAKVVVKKPRV